MSKAPPAEFTRQDWISACEFHPLNEKEIFAEIDRRLSKHKNALVLLDLDSTLYEVGPRTYAILKEWQESSAAAAFPEVRTALDSLKHDHIGYSIRDTFKLLGIDVESPKHVEAFDSAKSFWGKRFFSNDYLKNDRPYPGAVEFAKQVYQAGATLIYLTGRDEPNMGLGTRQNLLRDGFPWEAERTHLLLKKSPSIDDLSHKRDAADYIRRHGTLIASFENEPKNLVALFEIFPDAMHIFVDTIFSDHAAAAGKGLYRIRGFSG